MIVDVNDQAEAIAASALKKMEVGKARNREAAEQFKDAHPYDYNHIACCLRDRYSVISFKKCLYRYQEGIYVEDDGFLDSCITNELLERGIDEKGRITTAAQQVRHYLTYGKVESEYPFNTYPDAIPVRNGILKIDFTTGSTTLLPFSPEHRFNYRLDVVFDGDADGTPILNYLDSLGTDTNILLQIPAHALLGMLGRVYKKAYFLKGTKNSGKSTYNDLLTRHLFGTGVCSAISLQDLLYGRFRLAELEGKVMNSYADLSDQKIQNIGVFKSLTGGDEVTIEKKHRDPYKLRNRALLLFSGNKYPKIDVGDEAFWDRWIALLFSKSFKVDPTFELRTFTETNISGLLNLVLIKMQKIITDGSIATTDSVETQWLNDGSSCHRFIQECLEKCPGALLVKEILYQEYIKFCNEGNYEVEAKRNLTEAMNQRGAVEVRPTIAEKRQHCYQGYKVESKNAVKPDKENQQVWDDVK